jgi:cytochrome c553
VRRIPASIALLALVMVCTAQAKAPWLKQAADLGLTGIKDCKSCHGAKNTGTSLNRTGKWMVAQKALRKADACDVAWLKEYNAKKK